jgi:hypothetical protein
MEKALVKTKKYPALQTWSREMAIWYACQSAKPSTEQCIEHCAEIGHPVSKGYWYNVSASPEFRTLVKELQASGTALAKLKFEQNYPKVVDHFTWALEQARAVNDYNAVRALTEMALDRFMPKKSEGPQVAAQFNIQISPERVRDFDMPAVSVEATEVEIEDGNTDV